MLSPNDLSWGKWIERVQEADLNYVGLHASFGQLLSFLQSQKGASVLAAAARADIEVGFELHILSVLLPRELWEGSPRFFRMDKEGNRTADANFCVSNPTALAIVQENAGQCAETLRQFWDIDRYYFWPDDNRPWCHCPSCRELSPSDQCLVYTNALWEALRRGQPEAKVAYLAYTTTLDVPSRVRHGEGVFLQYAPIYRSYEYPLDDPECEENRYHTEALQALCAFFGAADAQVLEYWLDVSRFSNWRRPVVPLHFSQEILERDVALYAGLGLRRLSTFAVWIDEQYIKAFGEPPLESYGEALSKLFR